MSEDIVWAKEEAEIKEQREMLGEDLGYTGEECPACGRVRVIRYANGYEICEKCEWCEQIKGYFEWR